MISASLVKELREKTGAGMMDCKKALVETNGNMDEAVKWLREKGIAKAEKKSSRIAAEGVCTFAVSGNKATLFEVNSETDFVAKNPLFAELTQKIASAILNNDVHCTDCALKAEYEGVTVEKLIVDATATIGEKISLRRVNVFNKTDDQVFGTYSHMGGKIAVLTVLNGSNADVAKDVAMHVAAMNPKFLDREVVDAAWLESETQIIKTEALNENAQSAKPKPEAIIEKMVVGRVNKMLKEICLVDQAFVKNPDLTVGQYVKNSGCQVVSYTRLEVGEGIEKRQDDFVAEVMAAVNK